MSETMTKEGKTWTAERDAQLRKLHATGLSTRKIGAAMGLSGNAIIGRIHRLGIQRGGQGRSAVVRVKRVLEPKVALPATIKAKSLPPVGLRALAAQRQREAPKALPVEAVPSSRIDLEQLEAWMCHWISGDVRSGDYSYCGENRKEGSAYCECHHARVYYAGSNLKPIGLPRGVLAVAA